MKMLKRFWTYLWQHTTIAVLATAVIVTPPVVIMSGCTPAQVDTVLSDIDLVLQTSEQVETAIGSISPADAAALEMVTSFAMSGINAIKADYDTYEASKATGDLQKLQAAVQSLQTNLPLNLKAAKISSANAVAKATSWVNLVVSTLAEIVTQFAPAVAATNQGLAQSRMAVVALPTPESLQAHWQTEVCSGDVACGKLVKVHHKKTPRRLKL
jgi:hypothetical protein